MNQLALALILFALPAHADGTAAPWTILKTEWTATDERAYEKFVAAIGESGCNSIDTCMKSEANPYRSSDPEGVKFRTDCADLPYFLRTYFAWKNHLPFSFVSDVEAAPAPDGTPSESTDIRYSAWGNRVTARYDFVTAASGRFRDGIQSITTVEDVTSSAMFRFDPSANDPRLFTDHYPVRISLDSIRPGTMIYDPNGHVAVVYQVLKDGRVLFMDAHPDNSLTHGTYGQKFARSRPGMGAGFKNWRPIRLVGATPDSEGNLIGGHVEAARNEQIPDFSDVQFFGTNPDPHGSWSAGKFVFNGQVVDYYDFVRRSLAVGPLRYKPIEELRNMLRALCGDVQDRVAAVHAAIQAGIDQKAHPDRLPLNIYGTDGEWESFSSPSRDARLKTSFKEMRDRVQFFVEKHAGGDPSIQYSGSDLKGDLLKVFEAETRACVIAYRSLNLEEVMNRLFLLSFDPYHCLELRWGATSPEELAGCADDDVKRRWYEGEQRLRNQLERTYDARMDHSLDELFTATEGNGVAEAPDVDVRKYLSYRASE